MECFEVRSHLSDFLELLPEQAAGIELQKHLKSCRECKNLTTNIQKLRSHLKNESLIREVVPTTSEKTRKGRWDRLPWFLRFGIELASIMSLIAFVVSVLPKLIATQQKSIDQTIQSLNLPDSTQPIPNLNSDEVVNEEYFSEGGVSEEGLDQTIVPTSKAEGETVRVGESEVWRLMVRTEAPRDLRDKVIEAVKEIFRKSEEESNIPTDADLQGKIAPGGILFNFLVPKSLVIEIKNRIELLAPPASQKQADKLKPPFTWYKKKVGKEIPPGKTRVVVWLSQS